MTLLRTAWRRAVTAAAAAEPAPDGPGPDLADLLAAAGPQAAASLWECEGVAALGPLAGALCHEAAAGPIGGPRLAELAAGVTSTLDGVFEATRPGEDGPWLALRAGAGSRFVVATRSRALLDDLRQRFREDAGARGGD
jgi:hypothetical protein